MKKIAEQIAVQAYLDHQDEYTALEERWLSLIDRYENRLRAGSISSNTESKVALGGAYALVENAIPRLLSRQPRYRYLARERGDAEVADMYDQFAEYQWNEAECQSKIKKVAKWGLVCGLAGWRMGWKEEKKKFKKRTKQIMGIEVTNRLLEPFAKTVIKDEEETKSNYTFDPVKPSDLIWSVDAEEVCDSRVLGYKQRLSVKELKQAGYKVESLCYNIKQNDEFKEKLKQRDGVSTYSIRRTLDNEEIEVAELYVRVLNDQGYYEYFVITLGVYGNDNPSVIRSEENLLDKKFTPMGIFRPVDRLGKFYGFGIIEPVAGVLDAEEDTFNMALEALWTDVARPMEYNPANVLAPNAIKYGSRVLIPVKQLGNSVAVLSTPVPNMNGVQFATDFLTKGKQNVSGITDFQTGADQLGGAKTLGEIQIKTQESNSRIQMMMDNFEKQVLEPMGRYALYFNQQFLAENKKIIYRVLGKKGKINEEAIKFKDIEAVKDVVVISGSTMQASQQAELQKWTLLLNQAYAEGQTPNPVPINKETIWERILENGVQVKDVENFLPNLKDREEAEVGTEMAQMEDAKEESDNPAVARVLPTDIHPLHLEIHQAVAKVGVKSNGQPMAPEEMQMLMNHINDHSVQAGGQVPAFAQGQAQMVNQQMMNSVQPLKPKE